MTTDSVDQAFDDAVGSLPRKKMSGKKLVLFIMLPLLIVIGTGAGLYITGAFQALMQHLTGSSGDENVQVDEGPGYYHDLPEILVNLESTNGRQNYLKLEVSLELANEDQVEYIESVMPRIINEFQVYLRSLDVDELRGSAGLYRLREELLRRVDNAVDEATVRDVLFREMLVQ